MTDESTAGGTYTLRIAVPDPRTVEVGALGSHTFDAGWYAYTGSALGPGGFARVERHRELAAGERDARHWHVDYLLGAPGVGIETVVRSPGADAECAIAMSVDGSSVPEFGASDCDCESHLAYATDREEILESIRAAHRSHSSDEIGLGD